MEAKARDARGEWLLTGEFSRLSRLSVKALRLYDAIGLLAPARVDPDSGYRYYQPTQLARARLVSLLRQLEMPLDRIASLLDLPAGEAARAIEQYWQGVEASQREKRQLVRYLRGLLEGKGASMFEVQTRHVREQKVATIERRMFAPGLPTFIGEAMTTLYTQLQRAGARPEGAPFVLYHGEVTNENDAPVEVCVPFQGSLEPTGETRVRLEPAHDEAFTRISKAQVVFPEILGAYDACQAWLTGNGKSMSLSPREVYFVAWDDIGPNDPACDIAVPYRA